MHLNVQLQKITHFTKEPDRGNIKLINLGKKLIINKKKSTSTITIIIYFYNVIHRYLKHFVI